MAEVGERGRRDLAYLAPGGRLKLPRIGVVEEDVIDLAISGTNRMFEMLSDASPYVFDLLGMRNLSAFVGAAFAAELSTASDGLLRLNPHQDGYPDLLLMDDEGKRVIANVNIDEKLPFSPFLPGGIEVKATCGDVPTPAQLARFGRTKPMIGDSRIEVVRSINWKAHHRETNHLAALIWDFVDELPAIAALLYSDTLIEDDWGAIVQPREGGGRTTSVSIMARSGVAKLCRNVVRVLPGPYEALVSRFS